MTIDARTQLVRASFTFEMLARLFFTLFVLAPGLAAAQRPTWEAGPVGGWLFGAPTVIDRASAAINTFHTNGEGISWENSAIGGAQLGLSLTSSSSLAIQAAYSQTHGEFKSHYFLDTDRVVRIFRLMEDIEAMHLGARWEYNLTHHSYISAGLSGQYRIRTNAVERTEPVDLPLSFDTVASGSSILTSPFTLGVPVSIGLRIDVAGWLTVTPEVTGMIDVSELARGGGVRALRGGASIALMFHASTDTEIAPLPHIAPEPEPETIVKLHFTDEGIATNNVLARATDTLIRRYIEIPTSLVTSPDELESQLDLSASSLDLSALNRRPVSNVYRHIFDIVAERLRAPSAPTLAVTLTGSPTATARARQLLTEFFQREKVAARATIRTKVSSANDVTIAFDTMSAAISPLIGEWSERSYILPTIGLEKFIASPRGVRRWELTLSEDSHILKKWTSDDGPEAIVFPPLALGTHRLLGRLDVVDSSGRSFLDYDSLVVGLPASDTNITERPAAERFEFVLLANSTSSETWHRLLIDELRSHILPTSHVTIAPLGRTRSNALDFSRTLLHAIGDRQPARVEVETVATEPTAFLPEAYVVRIVNAR